MDEYWDTTSQKELEDLRKSLLAGYGTSPTDQTGGGALRLESLQGTLKSLTFKEKSAKLWQLIGKKKAFSTIEEYDQVVEPGDAGFYAEGGLPAEHDPIIRREFEKIKFLGSVGKVAFVLNEARTIVRAEATQVQMRTLGIIRRLNKALYFGSESSIPLEFNGLWYAVQNRAKFPTQNVINKAGKRLSVSDINTGCQIIADNYGAASHLLMSNEALTNYAEELLTNSRFIVNAQTITQVPGAIKPTRFQVPNGDGDIINDVFLKTNDPGISSMQPDGTVIKREGYAPSAATSDKAPATPGAVASAGGTGGSISAGTYDYKVTAVNNYGESAAVDVADVAVQAGEKVTFTITEGGGAYAASAYNVYRAADGGTPQYLMTVAAGDACVDDGSNVPGTTTAFLIDMDSDQVLAYHQLLPFFKLPLAIIDDSKRWLQKLYGALLVYNPNKIVVFKNVGSTANS